MITVSDIRMDILQRGMVIDEQIMFSNVYQQRVVVIKITKIEADMVGYYVGREIALSLYGQEPYVDLLREMSTFIMKCVTERYAANPYKCDHQPITISGNILCTKCTAKLGSHFELNLRSN